MRAEQIIAERQPQSDHKLRRVLQALLEQGLNTKTEPRAYTHESIMEIILELQKLEAADYENKLIISGFTLQPYISDDKTEQACATCMYYRVHQRFCELPELMLPVRPKWSCRLWRI